MDLKIPKIEIRVELLMVDSTTKTEECSIYVNQHSQFHKDHETLEEFLNSGQAFIPVKRNMTGKFFVLHIDALIWVREKTKAEEKGEKKMFIHFAGQYSLEVQQFQILPTSYSRTVDIFNTPNRFLSFIHENCKLYVNKNKILRIMEI